MSNELDADLIPQVECSVCKKSFDWDLIENGKKGSSLKSICPLCSSFRIFRLPSLDPYIQEFREKHGRTLQEELYPECDPLPNERR